MRTTRILFAAIMVCGMVACGGDDDCDATNTNDTNTNNTLPDPECGNGIQEAGEQCDATDLGDVTCADLGHDLGTLACADDCTFDVSDCGATVACGNGVQEAGEVCDGLDLGGADCVSEGFDAGSLVCDTSCALDTSGCVMSPSCGNAVVESTEACDDTDLAGETCESLGFVGGALACDGACAFDTSGCTTMACAPAGPGHPHGRQPIQQFAHPTYNIQLAVAADATAWDPQPQSPAALEAALVLNQDLPAPMRGFMIMRPAVTASLAAEVQDVLQTLGTLQGPPPALPLAQGAITTSHDGHPTSVLSLMRLATTSLQSLHSIRNQAMARLLGRTPSDFDQLSYDMTPYDSELVMKIAVQWRGDGSAIVLGALMLAWEYDNFPDWRHAMNDLANGTALANASAQVQTDCDVTSLTSAPQADLIWVVDESGSMYEEQLSLSTNAQHIYNLGSSAGLDFRMGVVNVDIRNDGALCTGTNASGDTFMEPAELAHFEECALEPWGNLFNTGGTEHGIIQGYNAVVNHLPRTNDTSHIRPDASLAVIYLSDEPAQSVQDSCGWAPPWDPTCLANAAQPTIDLLTGNSTAGGEGVAHVIGGPYPDGCPTSQPAAGYNEIALATGGRTYNICQGNLAPVIWNIMESVLGQSSPLVLSPGAISASLAVAVENKSTQPSTLIQLPRSQSGGFSYNPVHNSVVLYDQGFSQYPYEIVLSYERWIP